MRLLFLLLILSVLACQPESKIKSSYKSIPDYKIDPYWYQGKAEITSYELTQNRYRDEHPGKVVMVFVSEDFLTDSQVKNDHYDNPNSTGILKNNKMKQFTTGLYDYSIMTSVFTPVDRQAFPHTLKVTNSSQDWCGQTYQQLNLEGDNYKSTLHSYFEGEADQVETVKATWLEDELPVLLRMSPDLLPSGEIEIFPSLEYLRLAHQPFARVRAEASSHLSTDPDWKGQDIVVFKLYYPDQNRTYELFYEDKKPYKIVGWKFSYPSVADGKMRVTKAKRIADITTAYWKKNALQDTILRKKLGL